MHYRQPMTHREILNEEMGTKVNTDDFMREQIELNALLSHQGSAGFIVGGKEV